MNEDKKKIKNSYGNFNDYCRVKLHCCWKEPMYGKLDFRSEHVLEFIRSNIATYNKSLTGTVTICIGQTEEITDDDNVKGFGNLYVVCSESDKLPLYWFVVYFNSIEANWKIPYTKESGLSGRAQAAIRFNMCDENSDFYNYLTYEKLSAYKCHCGIKTIAEIYKYCKKVAPDSVLCRSCENDESFMKNDKIKKHI